MKRLFCSHAWLAALIVVLPWSVCADAEPLRDRVLQDVDVRDRCVVAGFAFPIQYVRHFPADRGDELRIRIRPRLAGRIEADALGGREAVRPPRRRSLHLSEVVYEGDVADGPYLIMRFSRPVSFRVGVGHDFRSIVVLVADKGSDAACFPE
jgi:hypothetical protein